MRRTGAALAIVAAVLLTAGCTAPAATPTATVTAGPPASPTASPVSPTPSRTRTRTPTPAPTARSAAAIVAGMSPDELAGQVLMTAGTATEVPGLASTVARYHLAGLMVRRRSAAGTTAVRAALGPAIAAAPSGLPLLTATDQEGGLVQVLSGSGFATMPSGVEQGRLSTSALRTDAQAWGGSLAAAGIRLDLAPVADVPCAANLHHNPPIADLDRQYGSDPTAAGAHVAAFVAGLGRAGVQTTVKHFPGLGCVSENTDTTANVVDRVTTEDSVRLRSFQDGISAGAGFVMVSSASYAKIDPGVPALFSSRIIGTLLRGRLGFGGVVMSDDVGGAVALKAVTPSQRAVRFVGAGGDLLLDIVPADMAPMHAALVARAASDSTFAATLRTAATRVVTARMALAHG